MATDPANASEAKPRRPFRYSLRTLMVVVTIICILCATVGRRVYRVERQEWLIGELQKLGGWADYTYELAATGCDHDLDCIMTGLGHDEFAFIAEHLAGDQAQ